MSDSPSRLPRLSRAALLACVLVPVVGLSAWWLGGDTVEAAAPASGPPALAVQTLVIESASGYEVVGEYSGLAESRRHSRLGFVRAGRLDAVAVEEGDTVAAGDLLAQLDDRRLQARRRELVAQIDEARARLALADRTLGRSDKLVGQESVSRQVHDEAVFERDAIAARLAAAEASLEGLEIDLADARLEAPYAAQVVERVLDEGTIVAPGQEVLVLRELGPMEARIGVAERAARDLVPGERHVITTPVGALEAELVAVLDDVSPETRTVTAIFQLPDTPGLRSGSLVRLQLEGRRAGDGFWLPITALAEGRRGLWTAYALEPDGRDGLYRVERRALELLHAESDRAYVRGTLREGDRIVASGLQRIVPGQHVSLAEAPTRSTASR